MEFEWDPGKAAENLRKHKVHHSADEHRYITIGYQIGAAADAASDAAGAEG